MIRLKIRSHTLSTRITIKNRMLITITISRKLVPHRLCSLELFRTFSTLSVSPCSRQLMHLCSEPWYINVRLISSMREISLIYPIKIPIRISPSITAITVSEWIKFRNTPAIRSGSTIKTAIARKTETTITPAIRTSSSFSPNRSIKNFSNFPGSSSSSSPSTNPADQVSVFIPRIMESAKLKTPRIKGSENSFTFSVMLT